jgi:hypothetical protein
LRAFEERAMNKELLAKIDGMKLEKTKLLTLPHGVVRALDDGELASAVGGLRRAETFSNCPQEDDCTD